MLNRLDCDNFEIRSNNLKLNPDFRSNYIMNSHITGNVKQFKELKIVIFF